MLPVDDHDEASERNEVPDMSSLWTPGGEIPVDRNRPSEEPSPAQTPPTDAPSGGAADPAEEEAVRAQMAQMRQQLLEAPAADVVAQHLMALYELAALHLSAERPRLADARLAIDAVEAVLTSLEGRLGDGGSALAEALPQLKMAYVEAADRTAAPGDPAQDPDT